MELENYFNHKQGRYTFTEQQASDFAKHVANDFNPIHDVGAKKFCVPGDLLFSLILCHSGLYQKMKFQFSGMVNSKTILQIEKSPEQIRLIDDNNKEYVLCEYAGDHLQDQALIADFALQYVRFSGKAFPHLLVPLMKDKQVMVNPDRPLVMYESMSIEMEHLDIGQLQLQLFDARLDVSGKRGRVTLEFDLIAAGKKMGCGKKYMVIGGLRPYEQSIVDAMVQEYESRVNNFQ